MINKLLLITRCWVRKTSLKPNEFDFLQLVQPPSGSKIQITKQEKDQINAEIDIKLQQLQDTGLSKEEILLSNGRKGLPLKIDPFFQYLKRNKLAREVYLREEERFTVEKVLDIALRQDIGPDPSYSRPRMPYTTNSKTRSEHLNYLNEKDENAFNPQNYYSNSGFSLHKAEEELKPYQAIQHIYKPINRYERIKTHMKRLKKYDIHWRNVELLRQFLTNNGNIKNRMINCISGADQKRIAKAIKTARHMHVIPHYGRILPPLKRNITTLEDQVIEIGYQNVNIETGHIFFAPTKSMDNIEVSHDQKNDPDNAYQRMLKKGQSYRLWINDDHSNLDQDLIQAQKYAKFLKSEQLKKQKPKSGKEKFFQKMNELPLKLSTGLRESQSQNVNSVQPQDTPQTKKKFTDKAQTLKKKLKKNPYTFSQILLQSKIDL